MKQSQPSERFGMGGDNGSKKCRMPFERKRMIKFIEKTPITQGWSDDYKYFALGADGKKYLLRVTPGKINPDFITLFEAQKKCSCTVEKHKAKQRQPALPLFRSQGNAIEKFIAVCYT